MIFFHVLPLLIFQPLLSIGQECLDGDLRGEFLFMISSDKHFVGTQ